MTETHEPTLPDAPADAAPAAAGDAAPSKPARKSGGGLGGKVLAELQEIAAGLGIAGAKKMRKLELIEAIKQAQGQSTQGAVQSAEQPAPAQKKTPAEKKPAEKKQDSPKSDSGAKTQDQQGHGKQDDAAQHDAKVQRGSSGQSRKGADQGDRRAKDADRNTGDQNGAQKNKNNGAKDDDAKSGQDKGGQDKDGHRGGNQRGDAKNGNRNEDNADGANRGRNNQGNNQSNDRNNDQNGDDDGSGRRRNRRGRNRGNRGPDGEPTYTEDDVLVPAAGILDILDNYAFVRTTGYLPSENDVYVSLSMVRKWGLRKGDAVTGQVRQPREGERKEKFNPMVRVDTVNGMPLEEARGRVDISRLTAVYPNERLRLETEGGDLTTRVIDLVAPLGKGQRGLVVAPPKAGSTTALQSIANAISLNNPECHLMVVLVDERPEDVTEMQRSVKGEVIASTFDRPASDHTTVAELAIERAERLVELGHDVVVLLDSISRLARAYNQSGPTSGRVVAGGVDAAAIHPTKKVFGAGRNVEDGGSLTIIATALVETTSATDAVILGELDGTATSELHLRRDLADQRVFPAVDVAASGTRRDELLLDPQERAIVDDLRRSLAGSSDAQQEYGSVLDRLAKTASNAEFLLQSGSSAGS